MEQNQNKRCVHQVLVAAYPDHKLALGWQENSVCSKLVKQRNNIRQRLQELAKSLETKQAEIKIVEHEIQHLEVAVKEGSNGEED